MSEKSILKVPTTRKSLIMKPMKRLRWRPKPQNLFEKSKLKVSFCFFYGVEKPVFWLANVAFRSLEPVWDFFLKLKKGTVRSVNVKTSAFRILVGFFFSLASSDGPRQFDALPKKKNLFKHVYKYISTIVVEAKRKTSINNKSFDALPNQTVPVRTDKRS